MRSLFKAFAFGVTLAVAVGPIAVLIVDRSVKSGVGQGLRAALGASAADFLFALVAFEAGGVIAPALAHHQGTLRFGGSVALGCIGLQMSWQGFRQLTPSTEARPDLESQRHPFVSTFGLTLINPLTVLAFVGFAGQLSLTGSRGGPLSHAVAVFCGTLVVQIGLATLGAGLGATLLSNGRRRSFLTLGSGVGVLLFAIAGLA